MLTRISLNVRRSAMHDAAREGDLERVRQLIEAGEPVDSLDGNGYTPLHLAARYGEYEVAALLIDSKCNINLKDWSGFTPLMVAVYDEKENIAGLLLHRGALQVNFPIFGNTLLHFASTYGWTDIVRLILDNGEADLNAADPYGNTPFMWAVIHGHKEVAALLIRAGADINRGNEQKWTALHFAVQKGHTRMIQFLLEKDGLDLNPQNINGQTPLHLAFRLYNCCQEAPKQLLNAGADINVKDCSDTTALGIWVGKSKSPPVEEIKLFIQKGTFLWNCDYERYIYRYPLPSFSDGFEKRKFVITSY